LKKSLSFVFVWVLSGGCGLLFGAMVMNSCVGVEDGRREDTVSPISTTPIIQYSGELLFVLSCLSFCDMQRIMVPISLPYYALDSRAKAFSF
jgi:hypothetical protein